MQEFNNQGPEKDTEAAEAMAEMEAALRVPNVGEVVTGHVVRVGDDSIMVDIGYKSEGIVYLNELTHRKLANAAETGLKVGDQIKVLVVAVDAHGDSGLRLSARRAAEAEAWEGIVAKHEAGEVIEAQVTEAVKGGLVVDLGLRAFLPASQVDRSFVSDLNQFVGQTLKVKIIELDKQKRRVILSRKAVLETERESAKAAFWDNATEGEVREGTVKSLTDFGAFVDLGGVDGLLHISEMSYGRIKHPSQVMNVGDTVMVQLLRLDREKGKISLGMKAIMPNPWESAEERYEVGSIVSGTVARLASFGVFVELEPGIDGLIHISELADRHVANASEVVEVGQQVEVKVLGVSTEQRRISLSLREAKGVAVEEESAPAAEEPAAEESATDETVFQETSEEQA